MKIFILTVALAVPLAAQDIAPKDNERDPVLSALLEAEAGPAVTVDLGTPDLAVPTPLGEPPDLARPETAETKGVSVAVEPGDSTSSAAATEVKLLAPFPAKTLTPMPAGWKLIQPAQAPPFNVQAEMDGGTRVPLSIRPHVLVPDADGDNILSITEPGFDPGLHYGQKHTIGAILADSIMAIDETSHRLTDATKRLEELLSSLPAPAPKATPVSNP